MLRNTGLTLKSFGVRAAGIGTIGRINWMSMLSAVGIGQQRRQGCLWLGFRGNEMVWWWGCGRSGGGGGKAERGTGGREREEKRGKGGREREEKRVI